MANERAALLTLRTARELQQLDRVILGTGRSRGSGVQPLGIIRMMAVLSAVGEIPAEVVFCFATGNTAKMRNLDCGLWKQGAPPTLFSWIARSTPRGRRCSIVLDWETCRHRHDDH